MSEEVQVEEEVQKEVPSVNGQPVSELGDVALFCYEQIMNLRKELGDLEIDAIQKKAQYEGYAKKLQKIQEEFKAKQA